MRGLLVLLTGFLLTVPGVSGPGPSAQLATALANARGGETILLADGNYGDLEIPARQGFSGTVTIRAATPLGATFGAVRINADNVTLDGLTINGRLTIQGADGVTVANSKLSSWTEALDAANVAFVGNESTATLNLDDVAGFRIEDNYIHHVDGNDLIRVIGRSYSGAILDNTLYDAQPHVFADGTYTHIDAIQMFARPDGTPRDIVIRGNYIYDDPATAAPSVWLQGIFLGGPTGGYRDIVIEENLVDTDTPNAIFVVEGVDGIEIRNNTVLGSGSIRVEGDNNPGVRITRNVARTITANGGAHARDNALYDDGGAVFQSGGDGATWKGFLPKPGTAIDFGSGYGALDRLRELGAADRGDPLRAPQHDRRP